MDRLSRHVSTFGLGLALGCALLPAACGQVDSTIVGGGSVANGVFLDSAVVGLEFRSGTQGGLTTTDGTFLYQVFSPVTFQVGSIVLGTTPGDAVVTPVALVSGAVDENHQAVINITRFLMTLDEDDDPSNGIVITKPVLASATGIALNFNVDPTTTFPANAAAAVGALTSVLSGGPRPLVSALDARAHLRATLLGSMAGSYEGTFAGDQAGDWQLEIATDGGITGSGTSSGFGVGGSSPLTGTVESNRDATFSAVGGITFTGMAFPGGALTGTWEDSSSQSGTFSGSRTAD